MRIALCPGSYDPVTFGHVNIIKRTSRLFDEVIVVVMTNAEKNYTFAANERLEMLRIAVKDISNVQVHCFDGLVAEYAKKVGACALVKGLRAVTDFEYEFQMALINKKLNPKLETVFVTTAARFMYLSSSAVREVASYGGDLSDFVPSELIPIVLNRLHKTDDAKNIIAKEGIL